MRNPHPPPEEIHSDCDCTVWIRGDPSRQLRTIDIHTGGKTAMLNSPQKRLRTRMLTRQSQHLPTPSRLKSLHRDAREAMTKQRSQRDCL